MQADLFKFQCVIIYHSPLDTNNITLKPLI